jgi:predicted metal-dependent hydrolase
MANGPFDPFIIPAMPRPPRHAAVVTTTREVTLTDGPLRYTLRRTSRARGMRVTIHPHLGVVVSVPPAGRRGWTAPEPEVDRFLTSRETWIRRHLGHAETARQAILDRPELGAGRWIHYRGTPHEVRFIAASPTLRRTQVVESSGLLEVLLAPRDRTTPVVALTAYLREQAREAIEGAIDRHATALGVRPAAVTLRDPRTRWGSCSRAGRLSLSWRLILAPPQALETVVVHELCHLRVFGHGPRFRGLLGSRVPDHVTWRRWLREHASELHAALDPSPAEVAA